VADVTVDDDRVVAVAVAGWGEGVASPFVVADVNFARAPD